LPSYDGARAEDEKEKLSRFSAARELIAGLAKERQGLALIRKAPE